MPDLWPDDFGNEDVTPPIVILREQADALARRTGGVLTPRVVTTSNKEMFVHDFMLEVPSLENYSYELFSVRHPVVLYPAKILVEGKSFEAADPGQFTEQLRQVLALPQVKKVVRALRVQAAQPGS